jgi:hypothetical protein
MIARRAQQTSPPKMSLACRTSDRLSGHFSAVFDKEDPTRSSGESLATKFSLNIKAKAVRATPPTLSTTEDGRLRRR